MTGRQDRLRAADVDRAFVAERLKGALDEGRLSLTEYDERLQSAFAAVTYGDLDRVLADLPDAGTRAEPGMVAASGAVAPSPARKNHPPVERVVAGPPVRRSTGWLRWLWAVWAGVVSLNLMIWLMVAVSSGGVPYFWPMWVAVPWGMVLLSLTVLHGSLPGRSAADR